MYESLKIAGVGMFIVFFALIIISISIAIIGKIFTKKEPKRSKNLTVDSKKDEVLEEDEITPELIAVITAAVQVAYSPCVRIHSIGSIHKESSYGKQGRVNIMSSHQLK